jgi:hypothetical protein
MLADDIEDVVGALGIDVRRRDGRRLTCFAPWSGHHKPKLEIELSPLAGKWNDWAEGRFGDALGLVACCMLGRCEPKSKEGLSQAIRWAKRHFGLEEAGFDQAAWEARKAEAAERARKAKARAARELSQHRVTAKAQWLSARPLAAGDVGWKYLLARGVDLAQLPRAPRAVRLAQAVPWFEDYDAREPAHVGPCLMSAMTLASGEFGSLHRTWIDPERPGEKADIERPRKMWPASEGCAIRLWRGESGLSDRQAADRGLVEDLVLCEGVEDGFSIALMAPELRVYAVGSLGGLLSFEPPKFVRRLIVAADNDWDRPQAQATLKRACGRFVSDCGKPVSIARSPEGKDFNDLLKGG